MDSKQQTRHKKRLEKRKNNFSLQNSLKIQFMGIGIIYLNREIDIGDIIEIDDNRGIVIKFHLKKLLQ